MTLRALNQKLVRDLWHLRGQMVTIALVVMAGLGTYICLRGAYSSLEKARSEYYERHRFADAFAQLERAPSALAARLQEIPGVTRVETRLVEQAMIPLETETPEDNLAYEVQVSGFPTVGSALLRLILGIPWAIWLVVLAFVANFTWLIGAVYILLSARVPRVIYDFHLGIVRFAGQLFAVQASLVPRFPELSVSASPRMSVDEQQQHAH